jgi:Ribbon-helix-helix protein, copG family
MADKRRIDIKVTEKEFEILDRYCNDMGLSKTVVLRELIRKLGEEIAAKAAQSQASFSGEASPENVALQGNWAGDPTRG